MKRFVMGRDHLAVLQLNGVEVKVVKKDVLAVANGAPWLEQ